MKSLLLLSLTLLASSGAWGQEAKEVQTLLYCSIHETAINTALSGEKIEAWASDSKRVFVRAPFQVQAMTYTPSTGLCLVLKGEGTTAMPAPLSGTSIQSWGTRSGSGYFVSCTARLGAGSWDGIGFTDDQAKVAAIDGCMRDTGSSKEACEAAEFTCK